jgi:hypothetical protein
MSESLFARGYSIVSGATLEVTRSLEEWSAIAESNIEYAETLPSDDLLRERLLSNARMLQIVIDDIMFDPENFRGVRDNEGNLQAAATIADMSDHLYLYYILTAPWNVIKVSPKSVRDAGIALILELVKESTAWGYEGRIILNALPGATTFYEEVGFVFTGEGSQGTPEMELTPRAAKALLRRNRNI